MAGLFHTLNVGSEALYATRQGVDTAGHNIANAQVEGYSRQRVNLTQRDPLQIRGLLIGNGVYVENITRSHDKFIENQLTKANTEKGRAMARSESLKQLEVVFSPELNANVSDEVSKFFGAVENLSNFPADFTVRTSVVEAAKDLSQSFKRVDTDLRTNRASLNEQISQTADRVSDSLQGIANLNVKIQTTEAGHGQQANDLRDQRDRLVREVSSQIDVHYYEDKFGMVCMRGPGEATLVDGGHSSVLGVVRDEANDGLFNVTITDWEQHRTVDITKKLGGGSLEAFVTLRDKDIPALMDKNDQMAFTFAQNFNEVHRQGFGLKDYSEKAGRDFFKISDTQKGAAQSFDIDDTIIGSNDAISAALSPMAPGDNVNINQLIKLKDAKMFAADGTNLNEFYANYTGSLGLDVVRAQHISEGSEIVAQDLNQRREAVSGVSLDEEATNMMKWQANFTATSKVITTVDEMLDTVLSLKR